VDDYYKVKIQTGGAEGASSSVLKMLRNTFKTEGIAGCYRGISAPLLAVTPMFAVSFWG
jgi:solute carrier family 25 carnitine/acylcarnitine transporter 20/29